MDYFDDQAAALRRLVAQQERIAELERERDERTADRELEREERERQELERWDGLS